MRATITGVIVAFALLAGAQSASAATCYQQCSYWDSCTYQYVYYDCNPYECGPKPVAEMEASYITHNWETGDWGYAVNYTQCPYKGAYVAAAQIQAYRYSNGYATGTTWPAYQTYLCKRGLYVGGYYKYDDYLSLSTSCQGVGTYYGLGPVFLQSNYEGADNIPMYLCQDTTNVQGGGGAWADYKVYPYAPTLGLNGCTNTWVAFLGYAKVDKSAPAGTGDFGVKDACDSSCVGQCGVNCNGIAGFHVNSNGCYQHDMCVINHGCNIWALDCLGWFAVAAVEFVVNVVAQIVESVIDAIGNVIKAVVDFLCFWC